MSKFKAMKKKEIIEKVVVDENEIPIDELPVEIKAYKDEHGYAIVIRSEDKRIGNAKGKLVDTLLVRMLGGVVPKVDGVHSVVVADKQVRSVPVADARIDEVGRLFVTNAVDGVQMPAATPEQVEEAKKVKAEQKAKAEGTKDEGTKDA